MSRFMIQSAIIHTVNLFGMSVMQLVSLYAAVQNFTATSHCLMPINISRITLLMALQLMLNKTVHLSG